MAVASLIYDEGSEQIKLGIDLDVVELLDKLLREHVNWRDVSHAHAQILNSLGDDFKAFMHLNGVPT